MDNCRPQLDELGESIARMDRRLDFLWLVLSSLPDFNAAAAEATHRREALDRAVPPPLRLVKGGGNAG